MRRSFVRETPSRHSQQVIRVARRPGPPNRNQKANQDDDAHIQDSADEAPVDSAFYDGINRVATQQVPISSPPARALENLFEPLDGFDSDSSSLHTAAEEAGASISESAPAQRQRGASPELGSSSVAAPTQETYRPRKVGDLVDTISKSMRNYTWANNTEWARNVMLAAGNTSAFRTPLCNDIIDHSRRLVTILRQLEAEEDLPSRTRSIHSQARSIWSEISTISTTSNMLCTSLRRRQEDSKGPSPLAIEVQAKMCEQVIPILVLALRRALRAMYQGVDSSTQHIGVCAICSISSELYNMADAIDLRTTLPGIDEEEVLLFIHQISRVNKWAEREKGAWHKYRAEQSEALARKRKREQTEKDKAFERRLAAISNLTSRQN